MRPTYVFDLENLHALDRELRKSGATVIYVDYRSFRAYRNGKVVKFVKVRDAEV